MPLSARRLLALGGVTMLLVLLALLAGSDAARPAWLGPVFAEWLAWLGQMQRSLHRALVGALRGTAETGGLRPYLLLGGVSFLYGIFHAAGPGHGKVLISSFLIASGAQLRAGIALSFAAAAIQAVSAIALVGALAAIFELTRSQIATATIWLEAASYAAIAAIGGWLLVSAIRGGHHHHHHHHGHGHGHHQDHGPHHDGPAVMPAQTRDGRGYAAIALATGIRPCSGAVLVLLFALSQGIFAVGIAATFAMALGTGITVAAIALLTMLSRQASLALAGGGSAWQGGLMRALAIAGSLIVFAFGLLLLIAALSTRPSI